MAERIKANALLVRGPSGNVEAHQQAAAALADFGIRVTVWELPWAGASTVHALRRPLREGIDIICPPMGASRFSAVIGTGEAAPLVGGEFLRNQKLGGAVLVSPPGSVNGTSYPKEGLQESIAADFKKEYETSNDGRTRGITVMAPEHATPGPGYLPGTRFGRFLPGADYLTFSSPEDSPDAGITHVLTTEEELRRIAHRILFPSSF